jgi:hypothetical protein
MLDCTHIDTLTDDIDIPELQGVTIKNVIFNRVNIMSNKHFINCTFNAVTVAASMCEFNNCLITGVILNTQATLLQFANTAVNSIYTQVRGSYLFLENVLVSCLKMDKCSYKTLSVVRSLCTEIDLHHSEVQDLVISNSLIHSIKMHPFFTGFTDEQIETLLQHRVDIVQV